MNTELINVLFQDFTDRCFSSLQTTDDGQLLPGLEPDTMLYLNLCNRIIDIGLPAQYRKRYVFVRCELL